MEDWQKTVFGAVLTTVIWIIATYFTPPTEDQTLRDFYRLIKPGGSGWDVVLAKAKADGDPIEKEVGQLPLELLCALIGIICIHAALFATGFWIYGKVVAALILTAIFGASLLFIIKTWSRLKTM